MSDDLIARLEAGSADQQQTLIGEALEYVATQENWSAIRYGKAIGWLYAGAFESAALTLVPEDLQYRIRKFIGGEFSERPGIWFSAQVCSYDLSVNEEGASRATPALALTIAALKARRTA